nr:glycosyltransferase [Bdellovibrio sp. HAGR004]
MNFSLLMAVYVKDDPAAFDRALESVHQNSVLPTEVVLVLDGPVLSSHEDIIRKFEAILPLKIVRLEKNVGLGPALNRGLESCSFDWVARFDSDDVCVSSRFAKQIKYIEDHPDLDIVGSWIAEFEADERQTTGIRVVPEKSEDIWSFAKLRNPFNHMTVMYRKSAVVKAGYYQNDFLYEDYALWVRMLLAGAVGANIQEVLVYARTGNGMILRRGGFRYLRSELAAQRNFAKLGFLSNFELMRNLLVRVPIRLAGQLIRGIFYRKVLRD